MSQPPQQRARPAPEDTRTWAQVHLEQLGRNVRALQARAGASTEILAVVKADAYGHGAVPVVRECLRHGVRHVAVATLEEARALRAAGVRADLYLLSPFLPEEAEAIVRADVIPMISSHAQWDALAAAAAHALLPVRAFLKVDTGMSRSGCLPDEARALWRRVMARPAANPRLVGIATHLSSADEPDPAPSEAQSARFAAFVASLGPLDGAAFEDGRGGRGLWLSWANSPALLRFPHPAAPPPPGVRGFLARTGLLLYGIEPFPGAFDAAGIGGDLAPVLSWHARVTLIRDLPEGATIGYGRTFTLARRSRIATLAAGYADGLPRRLSNRGHVLLGGGGARCPIVGRISMDQCQVDVTDAPAPVGLGDVATLIGSDGAASQRVADLAALLETTPHEPTCAISHRVPRRYHGSGEGPC